MGYYALWFSVGLSLISAVQYAHGYYKRDNDFYRQWDSISRDRSRFLEWMQTFVMSTSGFEAYRQKLESEA